MKYPLDIKRKQNYSGNKESNITFVFIVYFVALTCLAAFFSTSAGKLFFTALLEFAEKLTVN